MFFGAFSACMVLDGILTGKVTSWRYDGTRYDEIQFLGNFLENIGYLSQLKFEDLVKNIADAKIYALVFFFSKTVKLHIKLTPTSI